MSESQFLLLQQKLDNHIDDFNKHCESEEKRWDHLIAAQEHNSECIKELTKSTQALTTSTEGVVNAWDAANGTMKTISVIGRISKAVTGIVVFILAVYGVLCSFGEPPT